MARSGTKSLSGAKWKPDFVVKSVPVLGSNPHSSAKSGDFNGDGFLDIVNGGPAVALGNGDGTFQKPIVYPTKESAKYIHAADFNNDGRLDLAIGIVGANNTVEVAVLLGNNDGTFQSQINLGSLQYSYGEDVADLDGDGNLDIICANRLNNIPVVTVFLGEW